jgi:uncharacterized Fe-S cluster-containing radical SAM superfamily protein
MNNDIFIELILQSGVGKKLVHPTSPSGFHISIDPQVKNILHGHTETVIRECMKLVDKQSSEKIAKHFGVK